MSFTISMSLTMSLSMTTSSSHALDDVYDRVLVLGLCILLLLDHIIENDLDLDHVALFGCGWLEQLESGRVA